MCTDLVKVYCGRSTGLFKYSFPFRVIYQTRNVAKIMLPVLHFYMKIIVVTIIHTNLVTNSLLSFYFIFTKSKNKNQIFSNW